MMVEISDAPSAQERSRGASPSRCAISAHPANPLASRQSLRFALARPAADKEVDPTTYAPHASDLPYVRGYDCAHVCVLRPPRLASVHLHGEQSLVEHANASRIDAVEAA